MNNILYKEDENLKMLKSDEETFLFDKNTGTSYFWGKTKSETPDFDEFSPQTIEIVIDSKFSFDEYNFQSLLNINLNVDENFDKTKYFLSTISTIEIYLSKNDLSNQEVKKLIDYIKNYKINVMIKLDYNNDISLKELMKIKLLGIDTIILNVKTISEELLNSVKTFIAKNIYVNCNFYLNGKNINDFDKIFNELPMLINGKIYYSLKYDDKIKNIVEKIKNDRRVGLSINNNYKNIGNKDLEIYDEYDAGLFRCTYNFIDDLIYPDEEHKEKYCLNLKEVKTINDYWYSPQFEKFRKSIIKKIKK